MTKYIDINIQTNNLASLISQNTPVNALTSDVYALRKSLVF